MADFLNCIASGSERTANFAPHRVEANGQARMLPYFLRGGNHVSPFEPFIRQNAHRAHIDLNPTRGGIDIHLNHSLLTRYAIEGIPSDAENTILDLGFAREDLTSSIFTQPEVGYWILSFIPDQWIAVYQHNSTGILVPFVADTMNGMLNICELSENQCRQITNSPHKLAAMRTLAREFSYVGRLPESAFKDNLSVIFRAIPPASMVFVLLSQEFYGTMDDPVSFAQPAITLNRWTREIAEEFPNITAMLPTDFAKTGPEVPNYNQYSPSVYRRIFKHIQSKLHGAEFDDRLEDDDTLIRQIEQADVSIPEALYRTPNDFVVTKTNLRRVMIIGSCLTGGYPTHIEKDKDGCPCDYLLVNNAPQLPDTPPRPVSEYDFQIIQAPLRSILPDHEAFAFPHLDLQECKNLFKRCEDRLAQFLNGCMKWNIDHGLLTFVWNFMVPQQNPLGRMLPRYDLRNIVHFIEELNKALAVDLTKYRNCYLFDLDQLVSTFGRRYFQDDMVAQTNHNAGLSDYDFDRDADRLEGAFKATEVYGLRTLNFIQATWSETRAMYRTIRQADQVKLVIFDIDDTLWRGVQAEFIDASIDAIEGWPLGIADAIGYLRRRGVLTALVSKNDEKRVSEIWTRLFGNRLKMDDFAARKINWRPKAESIEELLRQVNLLPQNVVFVDDNPVERAAVAAAFPGIRTLGSNPLLWRRILLWAAETQVPVITAESAARTEMIQAQIAREEQRQQLSREDFLASLDLKIRLFQLTGISDKSFPRVLELINKTNQFNTTGQRWSEEQFRIAFADGSRVFAFSVEDRFTSYGLVGIVIVEGARISQFVMSCRVAGMDVELAVISKIAHILDTEGQTTVYANLTETPLNLLARDLYKRTGFVAESGDWRREILQVPVPPSHIQLLEAA